MPRNIFINRENQEKYIAAVLVWLESDFHDRGSPRRHFWHNASSIEDAFKNCSAMVVLDDYEKIIGYMTWNIVHGVAEINIVEVNEKYRRQGLCKKMLSDFVEKFNDVVALSAFVLSESQEIFKKLGFESRFDINKCKQFFKIVKPVLTPSNTLADGNVVAIFSKMDSSDQYVDYYTVRDNPDDYQKHYFKVDLKEDGTLCVPIVLPFHCEGYIGMYCDRRLTKEGKAHHLFEDAVVHNGILLSLYKIPLAFFHNEMDDQKRKRMPASHLFQSKSDDQEERDSKSKRSAIYR